MANKFLPNKGRENKEELGLTSIKFWFHKHIFSVFYFLNRSHYVTLSDLELSI